MSKSKKIKHHKYDLEVEYYTTGEVLYINLSIGETSEELVAYLQNWIHLVYAKIANVTGVEFQKVLVYSRFYREIWKYKPNSEPEFIDEERWDSIP